jgi:hypothetical protein
MLLLEIIAVYFEKHGKTTTHYRQNAELMNVRMVVHMVIDVP